MHRTLLCALVTTLLSLTIPVSAQPSDDERARGHFQAAQSYFDQGRYAESAEQFDEAHRLSQRPMLLANAALAYERAGNLPRAVERLTAYLASDSPEMRDSRTTLETRLASLRARADAEASAETPPPEEPPPTAVEPRGTRDRRGLRIVGYSLGGAGIASGVSSILTGVLATRTHDDLSRVCGPNADACPPERADDITRGRRLALGSTVTTITAVAMLGAGVTLVIVGRRREEAPRVTAAASFDGNGGFVTMGGTF
jgi:hypothetical protein